MKSTDGCGKTGRIQPVLGLVPWYVCCSATWAVAQKWDGGGMLRAGRHSGDPFDSSVG